MPSALARGCAVLGCAGGSECASHGKTARLRQWDRERGTPAERGYGSRWVKHRKAFIDRLFSLEVPRAGLCGARLPGAAITSDSECQASGRIELGIVADHIRPVYGPNDPSFWVFESLQLLCSSCDAKKRQRESLR